MVPKNWDSRKLEELTNKIGDGLHGTPVYDDQGDYYFINGNNIRNGEVVFDEDTKKVARDQYEKYKKELGRKTLLLSINGTIGNLAFYNNEPVVLGKSSAYINVGDSLSEKYLYYYLSSDHIKQYFFSGLTGSTIGNLSLKVIRNTPVLVPPLVEQEKIAKILSTWDEAIEQYDQLIRQKKESLRFTLRKIFSNDSKLQKGWSEKTILECCDILDNKRKPLNNTERGSKKGTVPYYGANGLVDYVDEAIFNEDIVLVAEDGGNFNEYKTKPVAYRVKHPCWVNNHAHVLRAKSGLCIDYLFFSLVHRDFTKHIVGGTRAKLNKGQLEKIIVRFPENYDLQKRFSRMLDCVEKEINILEKKKERIVTQKQGLMQKLLTGKVRVKV